MRLGDKGTIKVASIPTGSLALDLALGIGGVPRGRIVEIFGPESSGKTTLVNHIIAQAQALGGVCAFIDTEHAIDPVYSRAIGVDTDELLVSQPDYGEQALQIADRLIASAAVDVVAIDSVAALTPKAELDGQIGDTTVGLQARLMSQALRKLAGVAEPDQHGLHLHQPDPRKDRRPVRLAGDPAGRPGAEVLRVAAARHPPHRDPQGRDRGGRQPGARESRQEQGRVAVPPGRVRHRVRSRDLPRGWPARLRHRAGPGPEIGLVLLLRRSAPRSGAQQRQTVPAKTTRSCPWRSKPRCARRSESAARRATRPSRAPPRSPARSPRPRPPSAAWHGRQAPASLRPIGFAPPDVQRDSLLHLRRHSRRVRRQRQRRRPQSRRQLPRQMDAGDHHLVRGLRRALGHLRRPAR